MLRTATPYFKDTYSAMKFFIVGLRFKANEVEQMLNNHELKIGEPQHQANQSLSLDYDGRYWLEG